MKPKRKKDISKGASILIPTDIFNDMELFVMEKNIKKLKNGEKKETMSSAIARWAINGFLSEIKQN